MQVLAEIPRCSHVNLLHLMLPAFCRPIYTSSIYGNNFKSDVNVAQDLRNALEEVFYQYQVDMTWAGHVHLYEVRMLLYQKIIML